MGGDPAGEDDAQSLRDCLPEVLEALGRLIDRVQAGELGQPSRRRPPGQRPRRLAVASLSC